MDKIGLELTVSEDFLDAVMEKFHFWKEDREDFHAVGRRVENAVRKEAGFWYEKQGEAALAVLTLGAGVDMLQEQYTQAGLLTECYMAETIAGELMKDACRAFNRFVERHTGEHVARYRFFGGQEPGVRDYGRQEPGGQAGAGRADGEPVSGGPGLEEMSAVLHRLGVTQVQCNRACCLIPKKSVVFLAELTADETVRCEGICAGCGRVDCPNRCSGSTDTEAE